MAGRYVVIEVDSDAEAEQLIRDAQISIASARIIGKYLRPNVYCQCEDNARKNTWNWKTHKKYGMWVHKLCGRPGPFHYTGVPARLFLALGTNLLEKEPE